LRVQRSRREIGIRIALGARRGDLIKSLVIHSLLIVVVGGVVGAPLALAGAKAVAHLLFGVSPSSLVVLAVAAVVCTAVAIAAAWLPARAACSVEPSEALRSS
jgi:ABC-type antimicrobial peptide transport system permease subunit